MNPREERGLIIAATSRLHRNDDGTWRVPSQTRTDAIFYTVNLETKACTYPDCTEGGFVCKHFHAASIVYRRDVLPDGTMIESQSMTLTKRTVYKQNWPAYNLAQATEKKRLQVLLHDLCRNLPNRPRENCMGRPKPHLVSDAVFSMAFKVYCGLSPRRFSCDLVETQEKGFITKAIPGAKVTAFLEDDYFTPILKSLIAFSAQPLRSVETTFAIDSSGFGSIRYERWYDQKYGVTRNRSVWVKAHIACGTKTNVVAAVRILEQHSGDAPQFVPLVKETRERFTIDEVSADKAYISVENFETVAECGGLQIVFKDGLCVSKVGPYDGHLTNSDAYANDEFEDVICHEF
jgi:Transposase DDE domain